MKIGPDEIQGAYITYKDNNKCDIFLHVSGNKYIGRGLDVDDFTRSSFHAIFSKENLVKIRLIKTRGHLFVLLVCIVLLFLSFINTSLISNFLKNMRFFISFGIFLSICGAVYEYFRMSKIIKKL